MNFKKQGIFSAIVFCLFLLTSTAALCDDTCIFSVTADDIPPNVVLLLDSGAEMEYIIAHTDYDPETDYTPSVATENEGVNGFFNEYGYVIFRQSSTLLYIRPITSSLTPATIGGVASISSTSWTINGRTIALPTAPSTVAVDGVIDKANRFRYSKNYLNWIFFGPYAGNGSDLPNKTRFYMAKKAILNVGKNTSNKAKFGIYNFTNDSGATSVQPLKMVVDTLAALPENNVLDPAFINNINNMGTGHYSPLAEGLADIATYYASPSSGLPTIDAYCQKNFVIIISSGVPSMDRIPGNQAIPNTWADYDEDDSGIGEGNIKIGTNVYPIPLNINGETYLDDVATYLYEHDVPQYISGFQNILTYTVGVMTSEKSRAYLINASNNGNGNKNLYDTTDPDYGKYHFDADSPEEITASLQAALSSIISKTATFTAPVVPVTRTTSGDQIYLAFFKPLESNFWQGNITKFGLSATNAIIDKNGNLATWDNGAMKDSAVPYWATIDWANPSKSNYMPNAGRTIFTYLGQPDLTHTANEFSTSNATLTNALLGNPVAGAASIINYIRGADVFDADGDGNTSENRSLITGDALHSEPAVFSYTYQRGSSDPDTANTFLRVFFGANDGMLHAVNDATGTETWGFVPPDQLPRLKEIVEGFGHTYFIDSSPKIYFYDADKDGYIDDNNGDGAYNSGEDRVVLIFGEREGGSTYYALDITYPDSPKLLWLKTPATLSGLGESWSEPQCGLVKTSAADTTGTPVCFIGGGYSFNNSSGKAVYALNLFTGAVVKSFQNTLIDDIGMDFSIVSNVTTIDADNNGFIDKVYVGDLGGNLWRIGNFPGAFPNADEDINNWEAQILFTAGCDESSCSDGVDNDSDGLIDEPHKFMYAPDVALEWGYDVVFTGSGDRNVTCSAKTKDRIYAIRDNHIYTNLTETDLVNVTDPTAVSTPNLDSAISDVDGNGSYDRGWYHALADGEKVLSEGVVFYKIFYVTTFSPNNEPCVPGGISKLYGLGYKTGSFVVDFDGDGNTEQSIEIGGGIGSKPVIVIREGSEDMLISVGSTNPNANSESTGAGVVSIDPDAPPNNIFFLWWKELLN